jgi:hypothetical protein
MDIVPDPREIAQDQGDVMRHAAAAFAVAFAACTPQVSEPEATVIAIYKPLVDSRGDESTDIAAIPMTKSLAQLIKDAETSADGPVFDFDLAGNCQDCAGFSDLKVSKPTEAKDIEVSPGDTLVEASFKTFDGETHSVFWDMTQTPEGWRVDNILAEGLNLRAVASEIIAAAAEERLLQTNTEGDEAVECMAYLSLEADAAKKATPPGDTARLDAASAAWRRKAEALMAPDELAQYLASSLAVLDDTAAADLTARADDCAAKAPA